MNIPSRNQRIKRPSLFMGWIAVALVTLIASLWAYWGGIENFHEGWYYESFWDNVLLMLVQYWLFALVFMIIGLIGIYFPKITLFLCVALGIAASMFFTDAHFSLLWLMMIIPFAGIGILFFFGRPKPRWLAITLTIGLPVMILLVSTIIGGIRVSNRLNDGDYGARDVIQNTGIALTWAPRGPGWPDEGMSYSEAKDICQRLSEDGTILLDQPVYIWRLPTVEEAIASQMIHGENADGSWDESVQQATYNKTPDKETPLWDVHSKVIYYWTDTKVNDEQAYIIVYNGDVYPRSIDSHYGYLSFRAVKE